MDQQLIVEFKAKGKIVVYNESCIAIASPIGISKEKAVDLIKNKMARLILNKYSITPLEILNEAVSNNAVTIKSCADIRITGKDMKKRIAIWNSRSMDMEIDKEFVGKLMNTVLEYYISSMCGVESNVNGGVTIRYLWLGSKLSKSQQESPDECTADNNGVTMTLKRESVSGEKALQRMCEIIDNGGVPKEFSRGNLYYYRV